MPGGSGNVTKWPQHRLCHIEIHANFRTCLHHINPLYCVVGGSVQHMKDVDSVKSIEIK